MSKEYDEDEKFREIDDEGFDDRDNRYFHFDDEGDDGYSFPDDEDDFIEASDMLSGIFRSFLSLMPSDMQEYSSLAFDAILAAGSGNAEESNRLLKALRKIRNDSAGVYLMEARNWKKLAVDAINKGSDDIDEYLRHERKALESYIRYCDKHDESYDFDEYLEARIEHARVINMMGESKGVFSARIELPEEREFEMEDVLRALESYYAPTEDDTYSDSMYSFLSEGENVIKIEYTDPASVKETLYSFSSDVRDQFSEYAIPSSGVISITIDCGKDIDSGAMDLQQVVSAVCAVYPDSDLYINDLQVSPSLYPILKQATEEGFICAPVIFQFFYDGDMPESERILRTNSAEIWGKKDIGIRPQEFRNEADAISCLTDAISKHVKKTIKAGDTVRIHGLDLKASEYKEEFDDIILLTEKKNG